MALPWPRRLVTQRAGDEGQRVAPHPCALRASAAPGLASTAVVVLPRAIRRDYWRPLVVTRRPGIDAMAQEVAARRRVPDVALTRWRPRVSGMQPCGELTTAQVCFHHRAREFPSDGGFHFGAAAHPERGGWPSSVGRTVRL
jgi:hypothetical protein